MGEEEVKTKKDPLLKRTRDGKSASILIESSQRKEKKMNTKSHEMGKKMFAQFRDETVI